MRKAIISAITLASISGSMFGQAVHSAEIIATVGVHSTAGGGMDTITDYLDRMTEAVVLFNTQKGYLLGTGTEFQETAVHYYSFTPAKVNEVMVFFGPRAIVAEQDTIWAHFYDASTDSMPATHLGSGFAMTGSLAPQGYATYIPINGISYSTNGFLVSVTHATNDTVCILSSKPSGDGLGEKRTRQASFSNNWFRSYQYWTVNGTPYDGDALILPIVDFALTGVPAFLSQNGMGIGAAFPLPATQDVTLPFETNHPGTFALNVYDASGKLVQAQTSGNLAPGAHSFLVRRPELSAGTYHYTIAGPKAVLAGKFVIMH